MDLKPVDADYFNTFNFDADLAGRTLVECIFRKVGDDPIVMWTLNDADDVTEVTDASDMPYLQLVWDSLAVARDTADATGKPFAVQVHRFGHRRVVVEWHREGPVAAPDNPDNPPVKPFDGRTIETAYALAGPALVDGRPVVAHTYLPPAFAQLPAHLVIYYTGSQLFWAPNQIAADEKVFGVVLMEYDDDEQRTWRRGGSAGVSLTYSDAMRLYADTLQRALGGHPA